MNNINWGKHIVLAVGPEEEDIEVPFREPPCEDDATWVVVDGLPTFIKDMACEGHEWQKFCYSEGDSFEACRHCGSVKRGPHRARLRNRG